MRNWRLLQLEMTSLAGKNESKWQNIVLFWLLFYFTRYFWFSEFQGDGASRSQKAVRIHISLKEDVFILLSWFWIISSPFHGLSPKYLWVLLPDRLWNLVSLFRRHCILCFSTREAFSRPVPTHEVSSMAHIVNKHINKAVEMVRTVVLWPTCWGGKTFSRIQYHM